MRKFAISFFAILILLLITSGQEYEPELTIPLSRTTNSMKSKYPLEITDNIFKDLAGKTHTFSQITIALQNHQQVSYTGILYVGSRSNPNLVVFDTGSGWLTVATTSCLTCTFPTYNPDRSTTSLVLKNDHKQLNYGSAHLQGKIYADDVCMGPGKQYCVQNFTFFGIVEQKGLDGLDGILGLSPDITTNGPSYIQNLKTQGLITQKIASFFIGNMQQHSKVMFGGIDSSYIKQGDSSKGLGMHWYPLKGTQWWQIDLEAASYGSNSFYSGNIKTCIMDTGTSLIAMPDSDFIPLTKLWQKSEASIKCSSQLCYTNGDCTSLAAKLKPIKFKFSDKFFFNLPPSEYLIEGEDLGFKGYCIFGISGGLDSSFPIYIFGDIFLRSYYSVYDFENKQVGIALHPQSNGFIEYEQRIWVYPLIIVAGIILGVIIIGLIIGLIIWRRRRQTQEYKKVELSNFQMGTPLQDGMYDPTPTTTTNFGTGALSYNWYQANYAVPVQDSNHLEVGFQPQNANTQQQHKFQNQP